MNVINSGNTIVDKVGTMHFSGNIIPEAWYGTVVNEKGKPNMNAIVILADVVYWYRPTEVRNEEDGNVFFKKKFSDDSFLQRSYQQISDKMGMSKRQAMSAVVSLEKLGVIKRHFRTLETRQGTKMSNVMFLELVPERLRELTYPQSVEGCPTNECDTYGNKMSELSHKNESTITKECNTNTENTTQTTNGDYISSSFNQERDSGKAGKVKQLIPMEELIEKFEYTELCEILSYKHLQLECEECQLDQYEIKERSIEELKYRIEYDLFVEEGQADMVDALLDYMSDIIATNKKMTFKDETYDARVMGNQFYRLDNASVRYVLSMFEKASQKNAIQNKKHYLVRMLLTAKSDMETWYKSHVAFDMANWLGTQANKNKITEE